LIADDNRQITSILEQYAVREGFEVQVAADGQEAMRLFRQHRPDLVLLDVMMPKLDGFEVCREIRRDSDTPVIMITDTLEPLVKNRVDVMLTAHRGPVSAYHSLTVPMTIINTLLLMLSQEDEENVMSNLDTLDAYRQRQIEIIARSE
jgi:CheY-like chemotaxis protein